MMLIKCCFLKETASKNKPSYNMYILHTYNFTEISPNLPIISFIVTRFENLKRKVKNFNLCYFANSILP
jgi:PII-like signaling protein